MAAQQPAKVTALINQPPCSQEARTSRTTSPSPPVLGSQSHSPSPSITTCSIHHSESAGLTSTIPPHTQSLQNWNSSSSLMLWSNSGNSKTWRLPRSKAPPQPLPAHVICEQNQFCLSHLIKSLKALDAPKAKMEFAGQPSAKYIWALEGLVIGKWAQQELTGLVTVHVAGLSDTLEKENLKKQNPN